MLKAKLTSKGQITIPTTLRHQLGLEPGDELLFVLEGEEVRLRVLKHRPLGEVYSVLPPMQPFPGTEVIRRSVTEPPAEPTLSDEHE